MTEIEDVRPSRKSIATRLLYTILYMIIFELLRLVVHVTVLFQYVLLFANRSYSEPLRRFGNRVSTYGYSLMRYLTLNVNERPFPFRDFPVEADEPESRVEF